MVNVGLINNKFSFNNISNEVLEVNIEGYIVDSPTQKFYKLYYGDDTSVSFKSFRSELENFSGKKINIKINSGGGSVTEAMAIHDYLVDLQENKGYKITSQIIGLCASAATYIAMAAKNTRMSENSWFMIHLVSGGIYGDVNEIIKYAETLRKFNASIVSFYSNRTSLSEGEVLDMMVDETWLTANEAKDYGFINTITSTQKFNNKIENKYWGFSNTNVLEAYNSFTINTEDMSEKNEQKGLIASIKNVMTEVFESFTNKGDSKESKKVEVENGDTPEVNHNKPIDNSINFSESIVEKLTNAIAPLLLTKEDVENVAQNYIDANVGKDSSLNETQMKEIKNHIETILVNKAGNISSPTNEKPIKQFGKIV